MPGAYNPERRTSSIDPGPMGPGIKGGPDQVHPAPPTKTTLGRSRSAHCFVKGETMVIPPKLKPSPHFIEEEMRGGPSSPQSMHEEEHIVPEDGLRAREDSTSREAGELPLYAVAMVM